MSARWIGRNVCISLALVSVLAISGCGISPVPFDRYDAPASIRNDSGDLSVVYCRNLKVDTIVIQERITPDSDWVTLFRAKGVLELERGDNVVQEAQSQGLELSPGSHPHMTPRSQILVMLYGMDASYISIFNLESDLSDHLWLHPDGSQTLEACPTK